MSSTQTHDVELNGGAYMVIPGSYKSYPDGNLYVDSRLQRQVLSDFTAGMAGPKVNARDLASSGVYGQASLGAWPAPWPLGVSAIGPAPVEVVSAVDVGAVPTAFTRHNGYLFIAVGDELWRYDPAAGSATLRYTAANPIVDITRVATGILMSFGQADYVASWNDDTASVNTNATNNEATLMRTIGLRVAGNNANNLTQMFLYYSNLNSESDIVDGPVIQGTVYDDAILFATERSLWAYTPAGASDFSWSHWGVVSSDGLQNADDYVWMQTFQGRLMTWQGGRAVVYDRQRGWWRHAGFEAAESYGAAVVNGWLIVAARPRGGTATQLWGYNGSGWWLMAEGDWTTIAAASGGRLLAFGPGDGTVRYWDMDVASDATQIVPQFTIDSTLIDGNAPDTAKYWTTIGVELARANGDSVGAWDVQLSYSLDAGASWTAAGDPLTVDEATASVSAAVGAESALLRIRVELTQTSGLPPHVLSMWAEYELYNESIRRRRWQFKVAATDRALDRAGALAAVDGETVRAGLWELFDGPASFAFRDVDGGEHTVRLIGLREEWLKPADAPKIGAHSTFEVVLVEL